MISLFCFLVNIRFICTSNSPARFELARQSRDVQQSQVDYYEVQVNIKSGDLASSTVNNDRALMQEIVDKDKSIQEMEKEVEKMEKRLNFQTVIAPVDGIIQDIGVNTVGSVVSSEKPIVTMVPADTKLVLKAFVLNRDIGYVKVGQKVDIKLDTFPFQRYGVIHGKIISISPDAVKDEKNGYVYRIKVEPLEKTIKAGKKDMAISPGMTAQAEIKTGKRRVIEFFLPGIEEVKDGFELM